MIIIIMKLCCRGMAIVQSSVHIIISLSQCNSFALRNNTLTPTSYYTYYYTTSFIHTDFILRDYIEYFYFLNLNASNWRERKKKGKKM